MTGSVVARASHGVLDPNVADEVTFEAQYQTVTVINLSTFPLFVTTDGVTAVLYGDETFLVPAGTYAELPVLKPVSGIASSVTDISLIAAGVASYSVLVHPIQLRSIDPAAASVAAAASGGDTTTVNGLPLGLPGATLATRFVGATSSGAPTSGTFAVGDFVLSRADGVFWACTVAGSPGTWVHGTGSYLTTDQLGQPFGPASLDGSGNNVQPPAVHTHPIQVRDNGGTLYQPQVLNVLNTGLLTNHTDTGVLDLNLADPGNRRLRVGGALGDVTNSVTNTTSVFTLADLTSSLVVGDQFDFYIFLIVSSTQAAGFRVSVHGPTGSSLYGNFFGPSVGQTTFDTTSLRFTTINNPANGPQQFGGFGDAVALDTVRIEGSVRMPTGATSGTFEVRIAQATATSGVTTGVVPFHSKAFLIRA